MMRIAADVDTLGDGLTAAEARDRLEREGPNAIPDVAERPTSRALRKLWAPIPWMLEIAIALAFVLGDYGEAGVVAILLVFNAGLGFFQESRSAATLTALKSRLAIVTPALRSDVWTIVPAADLVTGDVVKLSLGAIVPADVRILDGSVLLDQSTLTGESLPVEATAGVVTFAGALVRRGEASAAVIATGKRTKFGRTAELVRTASVESTEQKAIFHVVRNLVVFNGTVTVLLTAYAVYSHVPREAIAPLVLVAVLASIPVALPSMFTLAAAIGARSLASKGVLPTRLSAVDEAAGIDVLCCDKTGTLTRNELSVTTVRALASFVPADVLQFAAFASSNGGEDAVDAAIQREAARARGTQERWLLTFVPFDPALKRAEATIQDARGNRMHVIKGAFDAVAGLITGDIAGAKVVSELEKQGLRVLAVAVGDAGMLAIAGFIALSDAPRPDARALVARLGALGIRTMMVTGDAPQTARVVANAVGILGAMCSTVPLPAEIDVVAYSIYSRVLPEDKYHLVRRLQEAGHNVGMCGDGANDAPALHQAQMGIAVSTATDVAKSASGLVLTRPGLTGVVASIEEGRTTFQRILTYTLRSITHKVVQVLFLAIGLVMTGQAIVSPALMVFMMVTGDVLSMSSSTDNVRPSPAPSIWRIRGLTIDGVLLGLVDLGFCVGVLAVGKFLLGLRVEALDTLAVVTLVFSGQAVFYVVRERRHLWSSRPGRWLIVSSTIDIALVSTLAARGILMSPLAPALIIELLTAAALFAFVLDAVKLVVFERYAPA